jgi:hypothetical protein
LVFNDIGGIPVVALTVVVMGLIFAIVVTSRGR